MTRPAKNTIKFCVILLVISAPLLLPTVVGAAILYLEPASGEYHQEDTFIIEARIDTEGECINTVKADISFSKEILEGIDFSSGNSILTIWLETPRTNQETGLISFTGGIPGGYCGILPGELGEPNLLGKIIFQTKRVNGGQTSVKLEFLESSQVLLNDGLATPAKLTTKGAIFTILPEKAEVPKQEWQEELKKDNIPPETFEIEIHQEPTIFEGKYFIIFSTTDKQTGIGYYEIAEQRRIIAGITRKIEWKKGESPYLLEDQSLKSIIKVKAVDKAGNEIIAEYRPPVKPFPYWIILIIIVGLAIVIWIVKKFLIPKS